MTRRQNGSLMLNLTILRNKISLIHDIHRATDRATTPEHTDYLSVCRR